MFKNIFIIGFFTYCIFLTSLIAKDTILVSVPPQQYFVEQIAKDNFNIKSMMDENSILPTYKPTSQQYVWAEDAIAYFRIGMYDENEWIKSIKVTNKKIKVFDTTINVKKKAINPYIWLDPMLVRIQAKNIYNALVKLDSNNQAFYKKNYLSFVNHLSRIDYQIRTILKKRRRHSFIIYEPIWYYYAKRYNIKQIELEADPYSLDDKNILYIINQLNRLASNIMFIPNYYVPKEFFKRVEPKTKVILVPFSHLAYNWEENIMNITKIITYQSK